MTADYPSHSFHVHVANDDGPTSPAHPLLCSHRAFQDLARIRRAAIQRFTSENRVTPTVLRYAHSWRAPLAGLLCLLPLPHRIPPTLRESHNAPCRATSLHTP